MQLGDMHTCSREAPCNRDSQWSTKLRLCGNTHLRPPGTAPFDPPLTRPGGRICRSIRRTAAGFGDATHGDATHKELTLHPQCAKKKTKKKTLHLTTSPIKPSHGNPATWAISGGVCVDLPAVWLSRHHLLHQALAGQRAHTRGLHSNLAHPPRSTLLASRPNSAAIREATTRSMPLWRPHAGESVTDAGENDKRLLIFVVQDNLLVVLPLSSAVPLPALPVSLCVQGGKSDRWRFRLQEESRWSWAAGRTGRRRWLWKIRELFWISCSCMHSLLLMKGNCCKVLNYESCWGEMNVCFS
jgi:hypothetical protein